MSVIEVQGLTPLKGEINIQGSKNAVLPMMAASILHKGTTVIANVPRIQDVFCMLGILDSLGCNCILEGNRLTIDAAVISQTELSKELVKSMRSSIIVLGPLLARENRAVTQFPGGCSIGQRPIDLHLLALRALGAKIVMEGEVLSAVSAGLKGAAVSLTFPSVGATENAVMAAVLADGITVINGAAREPEIEELCLFLNGMGARISGIGGSTLIVEGVKCLYDSVYVVAGDRIVAGTYLCAAMAAGGKVSLAGIRPNQMEAVIRCAESMGAAISRYDDRLTIETGGRPCGNDVVTGPYPQFPTDLQSPMVAVMAGAFGKGCMEETVFEGRFGTVKELLKLGADIIIEENRAVICGRYPLKGASVTAGDLRGGAALVVGGLAAEGMTRIEDCRHIERGYEDICRDLRSLGAVIRGLE